jgi:hypothetical protein
MTQSPPEREGLFGIRYVDGPFSLLGFFLPGSSLDSSGIELNPWVLVADVVVNHYVGRLPENELIFRNSCMMLPSNEASQSASAALFQPWMMLYPQ